jgi:periplasmic divalent cation tolerance protein
MSPHTDDRPSDVQPSDASDADVVILLTTLPADADASAFAEALVTERLAACVAIGAAMTSIYTWKGAVERAQERQLVVKTVRRMIPLIETRFASLHPYEVPELIVVPVVDGGAAYLGWVRASTGG